MVNVFSLGIALRRTVSKNGEEEAKEKREEGLLLLPLQVKLSERR